MFDRTAMEIRVTAQRDGVWAVDASAVLAGNAKALVELHASREGASAFGDIAEYSHYDSKVVNENSRFVEAEYVLRPPLRWMTPLRVTVHKLIVNHRVHFKMSSVDGTLEAEGTWNHEDLADRCVEVSLRQIITSSLPFFVPRFVVGRVLRSRVQRAFDDVAMYSLTNTPR